MLPLKLQGIAEVVDNALVLRFKFTARPVKPSWVQREHMKRMYTVLIAGVAVSRSFAASGATLECLGAKSTSAPARAPVGRRNDEFSCRRHMTGKGQEQ